MAKRDSGTSGVLVIGLGRFGSAVAASLDSLDREVLAVEKSPRIVTPVSYTHLDPDREGLQETPARMGRAWKEAVSGMLTDPAQPLEKQFQVDDDELVMVRGIPFYSLCEHHLLPFFGVAHVAYIPRDGRITGLSKLARVVEGFSHRLQVQERLTAQVADALMEKLNPRGVAVVIEGEHLCMSCLLYTSNIEAEAARARLTETTSARLPALRSVDMWSFMSYPPRATFGSYKSS